MIKKYKHMREDFSESDFTPEEQEIINSQDDLPDEFFDDALDVEDDDIWDDDTYVGEDDDIHQTDIADSDDDMPEDFFDVDDGFDEDDTIDVEDPEYWEDAKEIDPNDYDFKNGDTAIENWSKTFKDNVDEEEIAEDEYGEYKNLGDAVHRAAFGDPAHSEEFKRIMSLEDMPESKKEVKKNKLKEDSAFLCTNKPKDENRDLPDWVYQKFGKIYESCNPKK